VQSGRPVDRKRNLAGPAGPAAVHEAVEDERLLDAVDDSVEISKRAPRLGGQASDAQWSVEDQRSDERSAITHDSGFFHPVLRRIRDGESFTESGGGRGQGLFDDVVGAEHQRLRNRDASWLVRPEIALSRHDDGVIGAAPTPPRTGSWQIHPKAGATQSRSPTTGRRRWCQFLCRRPARGRRAALPWRPVVRSRH
jgi:hypothetical protein